MLQASLSHNLVLFIEQQTKETFYYSQPWLDLMTNLFDYPVIPLTTTNSTGQITGFLPLCYIRSPLTGHRLVSLPFADYCPLLAVDDASAENLVNQAILLAQDKQVKYLELRSGNNYVLANHSDLLGGNLYVQWLKPLVTDPVALWSSINVSVRDKVKKARKFGVQVHMAQDREDVEHYYHLNLLTRSKKHGMPTQSKRYFYALWDAFAQNGNIQLWLAEYEGIVIASAITFSSGTTIRWAYNASDTHYLSLAPNHLLIWMVMSWAASHGYTIFNIGRTACDNPGLMEFKRRLGANKEPLPYYYYPQVTGLAATPESGLKYRLLTTCWRQLPLSITGPLGGYLHKHLG